MMIKLKKLKDMLSQFGVWFSVKYCYFKFTHKDKQYISLVYEYLLNIVKPLIREYNEKVTMLNVSSVDEITMNNEKVPIWVCWWQGYENMPELCKLCFLRLEKMIPENAELHLVTLQNYQSFVEIPSHLVTRFNEGNITMTTYSDILRNYLLKQRGGMWIDSTIFVSKELSEEFFAQPEWWSIKLPFEFENNKNMGQRISERKWSGFIMKGEKENIINSFVADAFSLYYETHKITIDYFIQNMLIRIAYHSIPTVRAIIDAIPFNNTDVYTLYDNIDNIFSAELYEQWNKNTSFYKLTYKREYEPTNSDGQTNFYGYFVEICKEEK